MQQCTFRPNIEKNYRKKNGGGESGESGGSGRCVGSVGRMGGTGGMGGMTRTIMGQQQRSTKTNIANINTNINTTKKPLSKIIPGFEKAIQRMKIGQQKTK